MLTRKYSGGEWDDLLYPVDEASPITAIEKDLSEAF